MPAAQLWRLRGIEPYQAGGPLGLSALHLYGASGRLDAPATLTSSHAPVSGALASLQDDDIGTTCGFSAAAIQAPGFFIQWDFGAGNTASVWGVRLGSAAAIAGFMAGATLEYWTGSAWGSAPVGRYAWPGAAAMTAAPSGPVVFGRAPGAMEHPAAGTRYWGAKAISADGQTLFSVPSGSGLIYKSSNGGDAWGALGAAGSRGWSAVAVSDDAACISACEYSGYIYTSDDSGATWTARTSAGSRPWQAITVSADGQRIAAAGNGAYIYTSADGGATWTERTGAPTKAWRLSCSADGLTILACPSNGGFPHTSTDGGATWAERTTGVVSGEWSQGAVSSDGLRMAACRNYNYLYTSADGGATWTERTGSGTATWVGMAMSGDGMRLIAGGQPGQLVSSLDGGVSWTSWGYFGSRYWNPVAFSRSGAMALVTYDPSSVFTILFPNPDFLAPLLRAKKSEMLPALQMSDAPFQVQLSHGLAAARDVEVGGPGTIYGTTKTKGTPNTPARARVVLLHQRSKLPVRETWSDPVTGNFAFTGIDTTQQFLTLAEDAAGNFRPVAANRLTPEVLP